MEAENGRGSCCALLARWEGAPASAHNGIVEWMWMRVEASLKNADKNVQAIQIQTHSRKQCTVHWCSWEQEHFRHNCAGILSTKMHGHEEMVDACLSVTYNATTYLWNGTKPCTCISCFCLHRHNTVTTMTRKQGGNTRAVTSPIRPYCLIQPLLEVPSPRTAPSAGPCAECLWFELCGRRCKAVETCGCAGPSRGTGPPAHQEDAENGVIPSTAHFHATAFDSKLDPQRIRT
eukprot:314688-Pelagomonas_calceolata.AAC.1